MFRTWRHLNPATFNELLAPEGDAGAGGTGEGDRQTGDGKAADGDGKADENTDGGEKTAEEIAAAAAAAAAGAEGDGKKDGDKKPTGEGKQDGHEPAVPDRYELKAPDGSTLTADDLTAIADEAKTLKLTQGEADTLVRIRATDAAREASRYAAFLKDTQADPKLGGAQFEETKRLALKGLERVAEVAQLTPAEVKHVREFFAGADGVHSGFVRLFRWVGKAISEDRPPKGGAPAKTERKDTREVLFASSAQKG